MGGLTVKAIRINGPAKISVEHVEVRQPRRGEVLIKVLATGFCGTDLEICDGTMAYYQRQMAAYPVTPDHEWVGEVVECGSEVAEFSAGDRVVGECTVSCRQCRTCLSGKYHQCQSRSETGILNRDGAFAEFITFPSAFLHKISKDVDLRAAALVEPTAIAYNGVLATGVEAGEGLAIYGDGPIGLLALLVAQAMGVTKIALIGGTRNRLTTARKLGADLCLNAFQDDVETGLLEFFDGSLPSKSVEATGVSAAALSACQNTAPGGTIVLLGLFADDIANGFDLDQIVINDLTIRGALGSPHRWPQVIKLIERGRVDPTRIVSKEVGLSDFEDGIEAVRNRSELKIVAVQNGGHYDS